MWWLDVEVMVETEDSGDKELEENAVVKEPIFDEILKEFLVFDEEVAEDEADDEISSIHVSSVEELVESHVIGLVEGTKKTKKSIFELEIFLNFKMFFELETFEL